MKVLCTTEQLNLTENKLYKVIRVKVENRTIFYRVISDDNKCRWYKSTDFRYLLKGKKFNYQPPLL